MRSVVERELGNASFENSHGVTPENAREFLVAPELASVDPDDGETAAREMWIVLRVDPYEVAYDPFTKAWAVVETGETQQRVALVWGDTLGEALSAM